MLTKKNPGKSLFQHRETLPLNQTVTDTVSDVKCDWDGYRVANEYRSIPIVMHHQRTPKRHHRQNHAADIPKLEKKL